MLAADVAEHFEHGCVRPLALDRRRSAAPGAEAALLGQLERQVQHGRLTDTGRSTDQHYAAVALRRPREVFPQYPGDLAPANERAPLQRSRRVQAAHCALQPGAQPLRRRARDGAELALQRLFHALELAQRAAEVTLVGHGPHQREVRRLVCRLLPQHRVPLPGEPQAVEVQQPCLVSGSLGPGLEEIIREQRATIECDGGRGQILGVLPHGALGRRPEMIQIDLDGPVQPHHVVAGVQGVGAKGPAGVVRGLVQAGRGGRGVDAGPYQLEQLLAMQPATVGQRERLDQRRGVSAPPS